MIDSLLVNPHISDYLATLMPDLPDVLENMYANARDNRIPVIRREAQMLLRFLILDKQPMNVLEIGTAIGFSACFMAEYMPVNSSIVTIEKDEERYCLAKENTARFSSDYASRKEGKCPEITCVCDDAEAYLKKLREEGRTFDFIFLDAAKAQYPVYLSVLHSLMKPNTVLLTDNVMQEGSVAESKFTVTRRDRTIHIRMREFTDELFRSGLYESVMLPLGDGMTISMRRKESSHE